MPEIEVYNKNLYPCRFYVTTTYTRKTTDDRYYSSNPLQYVGKYINTIHTLTPDNNIKSTAIFDIDGIEFHVEYRDDGTTCFCEINMHK